MSSWLKTVLERAKLSTVVRAVDFDNNTALHNACLGTKYDTIVLLLEQFDAPCSHGISIKTKCSQEASHRSSLGKRSSGRSSKHRIHGEHLSSSEGIP
jgi:hypothetical protein